MSCYRTHVGKKRIIITDHAFTRAQQRLCVSYKQVKKSVPVAIAASGEDAIGEYVFNVSAIGLKWKVLKKGRHYIVLTAVLPCR